MPRPVSAFIAPQAGSRRTVSVIDARQPRALQQVGAQHRPPQFAHRRHFGEEAVAANVEAEAFVFDGPRDAAHLPVLLDDAHRLALRVASRYAPVRPAGPAPTTSIGASAWSFVPVFTMPRLSPPGPAVCRPDQVLARRTTRSAGRTIPSHVRCRGVHLPQFGAHGHAGKNEGELRLTPAARKEERARREREEEEHAPGASSPAPRRPVASSSPVSLPAAPTGRTGSLHTPSGFPGGPAYPTAPSRRLRGRGPAAPMMA